MGYRDPNDWQEQLQASLRRAQPSALQCLRNIEDIEAFRNYDGVHVHIAMSKALVYGNHICVVVKNVFARF